MGSINLDNTGSGSGITLSSDGTNLLLDGTAIGGGGADLFAESYDGSSTKPTASGSLNAVAIGVSANASSHDTLALGESSTANANKCVAIGYNAYSSGGGGALAIGHSSHASAGTYANALGHNSKSIGQDATAIGQAYASGTDSLAAAIANNTSSYGATDANTIAVGYQAKANAAYATSIGYNNTASGINAAVLGATSSTSSGFRSLVVGGVSNTASGSYASVLGGQSNTASEAHAIAMGDGSTASHANSVSIGDSVQSTATNQINLGGTADTVRISETYTLPQADGTNGQVLTTNGSGALSFAAAAGGGADLYAANESSPTAQPSATGANAVAIGDQAIASGDDSFAIGEHSDATGTRTHAFGFGAVATHTNALALGTSRAFAADATAISIDNNSTSYGASGANSIAMGHQAKASSTYATAIGSNTLASGIATLALGAQSTASAQYSVAIGRSNLASGNYAAVIGSRDSLASADNSFASGQDAMATIKGQKVHASGKFANKGDAQGSIFILRADTTDATATVLTTDNTTAASTNQIVAANDTCITFDGTITAMQNGAQAYASFRIEGLLVNDGGTTTLANSATTVIDNQSSWVMALSADNTNNALAITCTGEASHNIRWVANIRTTEVTYA